MSTSLHLQTSTGWLHMSMLWGVNDGKYTLMVKRMVISFNHKQHDRGAHIGACWSLCQVGTRLTLDGSSTHWYLFLQLHENWAPTLHRCLQKEGKNAIKVAPHFYLGAKTEKIATDWLRGCEKTIRHCHLSSLGLLLLNTVTSWAKTKQNKGVSSRNPVKGRKEREEEEEKVAGTGLCFHLLHWCLEWKHPGVIRWDVTSGFHHGSASRELLPSLRITPVLFSSLFKQHCKNLRSLS